jgi:hypothetical protein
MLVLLFIVLFAGLGQAQDSNIDKYQFISPLPGSKLIMPENNIIIRQGDIIDATTINEASIEVVGSISGVHSGELFLSDDMRTLIFIPFIHFTSGEKVNVKLFSGIYTTRGKMLSPINFHFYISQTLPKNLREKALREVSDFFITNASTKYENNFLKKNKDVNDDLPEDFPTITVNVKNEPSDGYLFIAPYRVIHRLGYLTIIDNNAIPIYYDRKPNSSQTDFKVQQNGLLTWGDFFTRYFYTMDASYTVIDSISTGNGYETDVHDLQIMSNGHSLLLAYDPQPVRMDTIVPGGDSSAIVLGLIVQELDVNKNVVFQWRSWDHFQITDATEDIDLTQHTIDYVHGNAIELDYDGNLLISSRHLDEITKINKQTGEIIWRWGGLKSKNNQFIFVNDPITFSHQHDIRRLPNGNVTLFDNGNLHIPTISRAREYILDESGMTVELVWAHSLKPPSFIKASGNVQTLPENNKIIGWGGWFAQGAEAISEVHYDGSVALEILLEEEFANYRAFKFPWRTNLFITNPDSIFFESVSVGDSAIISVDLINNSEDPVDITGYYNLNEDYLVENPVPFTLPAFGNVSLNIKFKPSEDGYFRDYLHIRSDTETSRVAQVMFLSGRTDTIFSTVTEDDIIYNFVLEQNYPNPFNPSTTIRYSLPIQSQVTVKIYSSIGENISEIVKLTQSAGSYQVNWNASNVASGIYFYSIEAIPSDGTKKFRSVRKMILLK